MIQDDYHHALNTQSFLVRQGQSLCERDDLIENGFGNIKHTLIVLNRDNESMTPRERERRQDCRCLAILMDDPRFHFS